MRTITRRQFIKRTGGGMAAVGAVGMGVGGCAPRDEGTDEDRPEASEFRMQAAWVNDAGNPEL